MRQRMTWDRTRGASAPPAIPTEGSGHPAAKPDPDMHKYENGDTSSWAEDPDPGPYAESGAPAIPTEKQARTARARRKAAKCVRVAESILGPRATEAALEAQAYSLMALPEESLDSTLERMAGCFMADHDCGHDGPVGDFGGVDEFGGLDDFGGADSGGDPWADDLDPESQSMLDDMLGGDGFAPGALDEDPEAEGMLAEMLREEPAPELPRVAADDRVAKLESAVDRIATLLEALTSKIAGGAPAKEEKEEPEAPEAEGGDEGEEKEGDEGKGKEASVDVEFGDGSDPMGLVAHEFQESRALQSLYKGAGDEGEEGEGEGEGEEGEEAGGKQAGEEPPADEEEEEKAGKSAAARTAATRQAKARPALRSLGNLGGKVAGSELSELSRLWGSAPDVSDAF